jgi:hypothetical protein
MHSHGETNVTVGAGSLPNVGAMTTNAAKANDDLFTALAYTSYECRPKATSISGDEATVQ